MTIPESMRAELGAWNNGKGVDLASWVGALGSFSLAVGYAELFWPRFVKSGKYILRKGFSKKALRGFERQCPDAKSVEAVMNHLHVADLQHVGCKDLTRDKILVLGRTLKEIYQAKLKWQFPNDPCTVSFYMPKSGDDLLKYELTFWQERRDPAKRRTTRRSSGRASLRSARR